MSVLGYFPATGTVSTGIYGVKWDGAAATEWVRTDDASYFRSPIPYASGKTIYGSPFDGIMPWAGMVVSERDDCGTVVAIPKFWYQLTQLDGGGLSIRIAERETDGFSVSPAHMDRGDGAGERDVIYVGRYHCASTYKSTTGVVPKASVTRANFRTYIHNLGENIWQWDFATRFTIWMLYLVEYANWNSQDVIGYGCGNNSATQAMGYTDSMPYHTGTTQVGRATQAIGTQYRNIEGLWDNVYDWLDGCYNSSAGLNLILNPASFSDSAGGTSIGVPSNGYPKTLTVSNAAGFSAFYPSAAGGSDSTYTCDYWYFSASYPVVSCGGHYGHSTNYGLFYMYSYSVTYGHAYIGSRLLVLP